MSFDPTAQDPSSRWLRARIVAGAAVAASALVAVSGLAQWLVLFPDATDRLRDDAFYEFAWAANVAAGRGPCVSDGVTTSGVQLLWSLLLVPIAWLGGASCLPVVAPWFSVALHVVTAFGWWRNVRDRAAAAVLALCWLGHPLLLRECQNGQETALACLLASALWWGRKARRIPWTLLGVVAVLARADLIALLGTMSLWRDGLRVRAAVAPATAALVLVAANLALGGGVLPDSAGPMAWLWHANQALVDASWRAWAQASWWFTRPALLGGPFAAASVFGFGLAVFGLLRPCWPAAWRIAPAVLVGSASALGVRDLATPGFAALLLVVWPAAMRRAVPRGLLAVVLGLGAIVVVHWALRWYPRDYYIAPLVVAAMVALARYGRLRLLLLALPLVQFADRGRIQPEPLLGQRELELAGRFVGVVLPAGEHVGCFNSGLVTFHADVLAGSAAHGVVNLDGVVDHRSFAALQQARLGSFLDEIGVRFVVDNAVQFALDPRLPHACGPWFGGGFDPARDLVELARFDVPDVGNGRPDGDCVRLYWRRGRGDAPAPIAAAAEWRRLPSGERVVACPLRAGEALWWRAADGNARTLLRAEVATVAVVALRAAERGGALGIDGRSEPVLTLAPL